MAFQLILHPEDQVSYIPKLDADRDKDLMEVLMEPYDDRMRFAYAQVSFLFVCLEVRLMFRSAGQIPSQALADAVNMRYDCASSNMQLQVSKTC